MAKDFAHLAGTYRQEDWFAIDDRVQRFKPLMNDEYGRDDLGEMVGLLGFPHQKTSEYSMARYSGLNQNMLTGIPYSVLQRRRLRPHRRGPAVRVDRACRPRTGCGPPAPAGSSIDEYNRRAREFTPRRRWPSPTGTWTRSGSSGTTPTSRADELYQLAQRGSRGCRAAAPGLRRADLPVTDR